MSKYFYVYNIAGVEDSIVKMFNTDTGAMGEKSVAWMVLLMVSRRAALF